MVTVEEQLTPTGARKNRAESDADTASHRLNLSG